MRKILVSLFIFLVLAADLKSTISSYIHWIAWTICIFPFMLKDFLIKGFVKSPLLLIAIILFSIGTLSSIYNEPNVETIIQLLKLYLIFMTLYYFLYYYRIEWDQFVHTFNLAVVVNASLLIIGISGISNSLSMIMTGDGRWGTILAFPGSLVKVGTYSFYLNIFSILFLKKKRKLPQIIMIILCLFIIYMDGSRTGMLLTLSTYLIIPILYSFVNYRNKVKLMMIPFLSFSIFMFIIATISPYILKTRIGKSIINIINSDSLSEGLEKIDSSRFEMLQSALKKILEHPFVGTGAFSTNVNGMVVHNTYLQLWGDFGLLGLFSMLCIYFCWIWMTPSILNKLSQNQDSFENTLVSSSLLMLIYFAVNGLFHPYSTEFSEWMTFIIPITIYYSFYEKSFNLMTKNETNLYLQKKNDSFG